MALSDDLRGLKRMVSGGLSSGAALRRDLCAGLDRAIADAENLECGAGGPTGYDLAMRCGLRAAKEATS